MEYRPSRINVPLYSMGVAQASRMLAGRVPVAMTGASGACRVARQRANRPSSIRALPFTIPLCRQSVVLVPKKRLAGSSISICGSWAVLRTRAERLSAGLGRITPPTMLPSASTATSVAAVSMFMTRRGGLWVCKAPTAAHSSSPPSWAGLSMRMRTPLFKPGPTSIRGALVIFSRASRIRLVRTGTTLARIAASTSRG